MYSVYKWGVSIGWCAHKRTANRQKALDMARDIERKRTPVRVDKSTNTGPKQMYRSESGGKLSLYHPHRSKGLGAKLGGPCRIKVGA